MSFTSDKILNTLEDKDEIGERELGVYLNTPIKETVNRAFWCGGE